MVELQSPQPPQGPDLRTFALLPLRTPDQLRDAMVEKGIPRADVLAQFVGRVQRIDWTHVKNPHDAIVCITDQYRTVFAPPTQEQLSYPEEGQVLEWFKGEPHVPAPAWPFVTTIDALVSDAARRGHHGRDQQVFGMAGMYTRYLASHIMVAPEHTTFPSDPLALTV